MGVLSAVAAFELCNILSDSLPTGLTCELQLFVFTSAIGDVEGVLNHLLFLKRVASFGPGYHCEEVGSSFTQNTI